MNNFIRKIGNTCLHVALSMSSLTSVAASNSYYRTRKGTYKSYQRNIEKPVYQIGTIPQITFFDPQNLEIPNNQPVIQKGKRINELIIVDEQVQDKYLFLNQIRPGVAIEEIKNDGMGINQLFNLLSRYEGLETIHLISHASSGKLLVGGQTLDAVALEANIKQFNSINGAIKQGGDLLFYGCEVAKGDEGEHFLDIIKGNTHADVAASTDLTGSGVLDSDWDLEIIKGDIEATPLTESVAMKDFTGVLQNEVTFGFEDLTGNISTGNAATSYNEGYGILISSGANFLFQEDYYQSFYGSNAAIAYGYSFDNNYLDFSLKDDQVFNLHSFSYGFALSYFSEINAKIYHADGTSSGPYSFTPDNYAPKTFNFDAENVRRVRLYNTDSYYFNFAIDNFKVTPKPFPLSPSPSRLKEIVSVNTSTYNISQDDYLEEGNFISLYKDIDQDGKIDDGEFVESMQVTGGSWNFEAELESEADNYFLLQVTDIDFEWNESEVIVLPVINQTKVPLPLLDQTVGLGFFKTSNYQLIQSDYPVDGTNIQLYEDADNDGELDAGEQLLGTSMVSGGVWSFEPPLTSNASNHFLILAENDLGEQSSVLDVDPINVSEDGIWYAQELCGDYQVGASGDADISSIAAALEILHLVDINCDMTFFIEAGTLNEKFQFNTLANGEYTISVEGLDSENSIIHPNAQLESEEAAIVIRNTDHVTISNLTFVLDDLSEEDVSSAAFDVGGVAIIESDDIKLESLTILNLEGDPSSKITVDASVAIENSSNVTISSSTFKGANCHLFFPIGSQSQSVEIFNNQFSEYAYGLILLVAEIDGLTISENTFERVWTNKASTSADVYILGATTSSLVNGVEITGNEIIGDSPDDLEYGVWIANTHDVVLEENDIAGRNVGFAFRDVDFVTLRSNEIHAVNTAVHAFEESVSLASEVQSISMMNNFLYSENDVALLIELNADISNAFDLDIALVHNTIKSEQSSALSIEELRGALMLVNNIFSGGDGVDVYYKDIFPTEEVTIDYNSYGENQIQIEDFVTTDPSTGLEVEYFKSSDFDTDHFASLSSWQTNTTYDVNSDAVPDDFLEGSDLHIAGNGEYQFGIQIDSLLYDIDGDVRLSGSVDVGADQFYAYRDMCGNYTVGNEGSDFTTISTAVEALKTANITCDVNLLVTAGTYNETIRLTDIDNGDYRISMIGESRENVFVQGESDADTALFVSGNHMYLESFTLNTSTMDENGSLGISVHQASDISIENIEILENNPKPGESIQPTQCGIFMQEVLGISITHSSFYGALYSMWLEDVSKISIDSNQFSTSYAHIVSKSEPLSDVQVSNNSFFDLWTYYSITPLGINIPIDPVYAIDFQGISSEFPAKNVRVLNNSFERKREEDVFQPSRAMKLRTIDSLKITGNRNENFAYAIFADSVASYLEITDNDFKDHASYSAINMNGFGYDEDVNVYLWTIDSLYMANNILVTQENVNLNIKDADYVYLAANTFHLDNGLEDTYDMAADDRFTLLSLDDVDKLVTLNNIFHGGDEVSTLLSLATITVDNVDIDHNLYSRNDDANVLSWSDEIGTVSSLYDWQSVQPEFNSNAQEFNAILSTNYRLEDASNYRFATFIANLDEDIDGDTREDGAVDVGADQFICYASSGEQNISVCGSYAWEGSTYTETGTYSSNLINQIGCDSTAILNLTILESTSSLETITVCGSYDWEGSTYIETGNYQVTFMNQAGCDSTATLNLTILESTFGSEDLQVCGSYDWEGSSFTESGSYSTILVNQAGCDSIATLNLTILESTSGSEDLAICGSYDWEGTTYNESGIYTASLVNQAGCDSIATLNLTILQSTSSSEDRVVCGNYDWEGSTYTESGSYTTILVNQAGCDSTATLNLTILEPTSGSEDLAICGSYDWEGTTYNESGIYTASLVNQAGCDSIATLNLTILQSTSSSEDRVVCGSYDWEGSTYTESGSYTTILVNQAGCDSTATLNLTILEHTSGSEDLAICGSYEWEGTTYNESGIYTASLVNQAGCDSIATLNLTILQSTSSSEDRVVCGNYDWEGSTYTESDSYTTILVNQAGCDSTATLNLTILEPTSGSEDLAICGSYDWEGTTYNESGNYTASLVNQAGCDSIATLNLTILQSTSSSEDRVVCGSYDWEGSTYTESGSYTTILVNQAGCDSTATLNLTILEHTSGSEDLAICGSYEWEGTTYNESGIYTASLVNQAGCDSIATLNLTILQSTSSSEDRVVCGNYDWEGSTYTESDSYTTILVNQAGCDSTATLNLTILEPTSGSEDLAICGSYDWEGTTYNESGNYTASLVNQAGCDSIATLNLTILQSTSSSEDRVVCGSYDWEGSTYTESGSYTTILINQAGCDSTATLNLTILEPTSGSEDLAICGSYDWEGMTYNESGIYTVSLVNQAGCDSIATLNLTILETSVGEEVVTVCDNYEWNGILYEESGYFGQTLVNAIGCDSIATLDLTILSASNSYTEKTSYTDFTWNGATYSTSGTYSFDTLNSVGCDSTAVLNLSIEIPGGFNFIIGYSEAAHFNSFEEAITFLQSYAFTDDVNFSVEVGSYSENINLAGVENGDYAITFTGEDASNVIIRPSAVSVAPGLVISLDHVAFENLTFEIASTEANAFSIRGSENDSISNTSFKNNVILAQTGVAFSDYVFFDASYLSSFSFQHNEVRFGYNGFKITNSTGINFECNKIEGGRNGIYLQNYSDATFINNAINIEEEHASWFDSGNNLKLIHNTFYARVFSNFASARIRELEGESTILNNIFGCSGNNSNHIGLNLIDVQADDLTLDYNLYATNAARPLEVTSLDWNGSTYNASNFSNWIVSQSEFDQHSQSFDLNFTSDTDLSISDVETYRFGQFVDAVVEDMEGDPRKFSLGVDVGADQYVSGTEFFSFKLENQVTEEVINAAEGSIFITLASSSELISIVPTYTLSDAEASANPGPEDAQDFTFPVIYTVTGADGTTQDWEVTVSVVLSSKETFETEFSIYPNPAKGFLSITTNDNTIDMEIEIVDLSGRVNLNMFNVDSGENIDISSLKEGVYLLKILNGENLLSSERIRVRR